MKRLLALVLVSAASAALALGLAFGTQAAAAPAAHGPMAHHPASSPRHPTITIDNFAFGGDMVVRPGVTVRVMNNDSVTHTLTHGARGHFNTGDITSGHSKTFTAPSAVGRYPFHCSIHTDMHGTLIVRRG